MKRPNTYVHTLLLSYYVSEPEPAQIARTGSESGIWARFRRSTINCMQMTRSQTSGNIATAEAAQARLEAHPEVMVKSQTLDNIASHTAPSEVTFET